MQVDAEARPQRSGQQSATRCRANQCKRIQIKLNGASSRTAVDHNIDAVIFHSRIEIFFYDGLKPMYLIDEQDIVGLKTR